MTTLTKLVAGVRMGCGAWSLVTPLGILAVILPSAKRGQPTAVMPTAEQVRDFAAKHCFRRPDWMPDWQWQRVQKLKALGHVQDYPATPEAYAKWIDAMLAKPPRTWDGFQAAEMTQEYFLFGQTWPAPVREHWQLYWWAWLMPDRESKDLVQGYIGGKEAQEYIQRTGDWRGNASVYRTYCRAMGTMNFNHWAANGVLLGSAIIGSEKMMAEGRHGLETFPLRLWCWFDGSTQESIDHLSLSIIPFSFPVKELRSLMLGGIRSRMAMFRQPRGPHHGRHQGDLFPDPSLLRLPPQSGRREPRPSTATGHPAALRQTPEAAATRPGILGLALPALSSRRITCGGF
jgi:hypothetical protein